MGFGTNLGGPGDLVSQLKLGLQVRRLDLGYLVLLIAYLLGPLSKVKGPGGLGAKIHSDDSVWETRIFGYLVSTIGFRSMAPTFGHLEAQGT